ncbi:hypothetical protein Pcinc_021677 [Petrolisthes cinctipes]|uniref:Uncharacterized protein n=1 Tax=Petrolisthes cinctipes TaxID=88211 RepID=A0AAE1KI00_PETCI|nr:hypothetical protein Pcinc_021677 [Petrolisthes cinctipes]
MPRPGLPEGTLTHPYHWSTSTRRDWEEEKGNGMRKDTYIQGQIRRETQRRREKHMERQTEMVTKTKQGRQGRRIITGAKTGLKKQIKTQAQKERELNTQP